MEGKLWIFYNWISTLATKDRKTGCTADLKWFRLHKGHTEAVGIYLLQNMFFIAYCDLTTLTFSMLLTHFLSHKSFHLLNKLADRKCHVSIYLFPVTQIQNVFFLGLFFQCQWLITNQNAHITRKHNHRITTVFGYGYTDMYHGKIVVFWSNFF